MSCTHIIRLRRRRRKLPSLRRICLFCNSTPTHFSMHMLVHLLLGGNLSFLMNFFFLFLSLNETDLLHMFHFHLLPRLFPMSIPFLPSMSCPLPPALVSRIISNGVISLINNPASIISVSLNRFLWEILLPFDIATAQCQEIAFDTIS